MTAEEAQAAARAREAAAPPPGDRGGEPPSTDDAQPTAGERPRDLSAELLEKLAGAQACLKPRTGSDAQPLDIAVTAHVVTTGRVSRAAVQAAALDREERECLQARVEAMHFATPLKGAPRAVDAHWRLVPQAAGAAPANR